MRKQLPLLLFLAFTFRTFAQDCSEDYWYSAFTNTSDDPIIDDAGNIYVWDNGFTNREFLVKYAPDGEILLKRQFDMDLPYFKQGFAKYEDNLYLASSYQFIAGIDDTLRPPNGNWNGFFRKMDLEGNTVWDVFFDSDGIGQLTAAETDSEGNIYVSGFFNDSTLVNGVNYGSYDGSQWLGLFKFDSNGNVIWAKVSRGGGRIFEIKIDDFGNAIFGGAMFNDALTLGGESIRREYGINEWRSLIGKVSPNGRILWLHTLQSDQSSNVYDIAYEGTDVYFLCNYELNISDGQTIYENRSETEGHDGAVGKLNNDGDLLWLNTFGTKRGSFEGWGGIGFNSGNVAIVSSFDVSIGELYVDNQNQSIPVGPNNPSASNNQSYYLEYAKSDGRYITNYPIAGSYIQTSMRSARIVDDYIYSLLSFGGSGGFDLDSANFGFRFVKEKIGLENRQEFESQTLADQTVAPAGEIITLTANAPSSEVQWIKDNEGAIEGATGLSLEVTESGTYYFQYVNSLGCTLQSTSHQSISFFEPSREMDSLVLVNLYNNYGGSSWNNNENWLTSSLDTWFGITVQNDRVVKIELENNNLISDNDPNFRNLTNLEKIDFSDNPNLRFPPFNIQSLITNLDSVDFSNCNISSVPDLSTTNVSYYNVSNNATILNFNALLPNISIANYIYAPQNLIFRDLCIDVEDEISIGSSKGDSDTEYQWFFNDEQLDINTATLQFNSNNRPEEGTYRQEATHPLLPDLKLEELISVKINDGETEELLLPTSGLWTAETITLEEGNFGGFTSSNESVMFISLGQGQYEISDLAGGFYQLFGFGAQPAVIGPVKCSNNEVLYDLAIFSLVGDGKITWNPNNGKLTVPWFDVGNNIKAITTFTNTEPAATTKQTISFNSPPTEIMVGTSLNIDPVADSGLPVTISVLDGVDIVSLSEGTLNALNTGSVTIELNQEGNETYLPAVIQNTFTIIRGEVDVTTTDLQHIYNGGQNIASATTNLTGLSIDIAYDNTYNPPIDAGDYLVRAYAYNDNYFGVSIDTMRVEKVQLTATADNMSKIYGETNPSLTFVYNGFVNGEDASVINTVPVAATVADETSDAGTYPVTLSEGTDNNYLITSNDGSLTVEKASLTVTTDDETRVYNEENPTFTLQYDGFVLGQDASVLDEMPTANSTATQSSDVGVYPIEVTSVMDNNYNVTSVDGTLTITKANQAIAFAPLPTDLNEEADDFELSAATTSGLDVSFESSDASIASISGITVSINGAGDISITASQEGNGNYNAADPVSQLLTIEEAIALGISGNIDLLVYPNPASSSLSVHANDVVSLRLIDLKGKVIMSKSGNTIDVSTIPAGSYALLVETKTGNGIEKVIIKH